MDALKLDLYFEVLRIFEQDLFDEEWGGFERKSRFICHTFYDVLSDLGVMEPTNSDLEEFFKEFFDLYDGYVTCMGYHNKAKPDDDMVGISWWVNTDKEARIRMLNFIISNRLS